MSVLVTGTVWKTSRQTGSALLLLLAIADIADDEGVAWPGINRLAEKTRLDKRTVYRLLSKLQAEGELEISSGRGRRHTNHYRVLYVAENQPQRKGDKMTPFAGAEKVTPATQKGDTGDTEKVTPVTQKGDTGVTRLVTTRHLHVKDTSGGERPIRKRVRKLGDLEINCYFEWLVAERAPHVPLDETLLEFVNYCQAKEPKIKDFAAAFENSILRAERLWRERHPEWQEGGPEDVMYGDFRPDNSPARQAYRAAWKTWKAEGGQGEQPKLQAFEHLNQRGPDG